jgi:hypothetical protein
MEDESNQIVSGWWLPYPSEKYESQLGVQFPTEWKNKKCSNPTIRYCGDILRMNIESASKKNRYNMI